MPTRIEKVASEKEDQEVALQSEYDILTYPADFTLEVLVKKWEKNEIAIAPGQRRFIWSQARASRLIESFLIGLPVPPVFFYLESGTNNLLVVDGQQRLRSIVFFFSGKFGDAKDDPVFNLVGLNEKSRFYEKTFRQLKTDNREAFNKFVNSVLRSFVVKQLDPKDDTSIFEMFERLNTGGVSLTPQEIRNCIYQIPLTQLIFALNKFPAWRKIVGGTPDKRMRDSELVLRFLALHWGGPYKKPMKKFLNDFMELNKKASAARLKEFETAFKKTATGIVETLGPRPFHVRRGLNAAVYDSVFNAYANNLPIVDKPHLSQETKRKLSSRFRRLIKDRKFEEWTISHTTDQDIVPSRLARAEKTLFK
jgi:hypothetical protein